MLHVKSIDMCESLITTGRIVQVVGPSGCGKTYFVCWLLARQDLFDKPIRNIYWHSGVEEGEHGPTLKKLCQLKSVCHVKGLPEGWTERPKQYDAIVIDDLFEEANRDSATFNTLFTKIARHRHVTVFFLTQNMFHPGGKHRTRNLNVHYLVLFKNPRDRTVVDYVARQAFPHVRRDLMKAFEYVTSNSPHSYLFLDLTQETPDMFRVKTDVFNSYGYAVIYSESMMRS